MMLLLTQESPCCDLDTLYLPDQIYLPVTKCDYKMGEQLHRNTCLILY